jgi:hypothetical protein
MDSRRSFLSLIGMAPLAVLKSPEIPSSRDVSKVFRVMADALGSVDAEFVAHQHMIFATQRDLDKFIAKVEQSGLLKVNRTVITIGRAGPMKKIVNKASGKESEIPTVIQDPALLLEVSAPGYLWVQRVQIRT